jgi:competence protein ComEC
MSVSAEPRVERPAIPPLAWLAVGLALGIAAGEEAVWRAAGCSAIVCGGWCLLAAACVALAWIMRARGGAGLVLMLAGVAAGSALGGVCWGQLAAQEKALASRETQRWTLEVASDPCASGVGESSTARVLDVAGHPTVLVEWPAGAGVPEQGERAEVYGSVLAEASTDRRREVRRAGEAGVLRVRRVESHEWQGGVAGLLGRTREWARGRLDAVPGDGAGLLESMLIGDKRRVAGTQAETQMRIAGLAHFESASGFHLTILAGLVEALLLAISAGLPLRGVLQGLVLSGFLALSGGRFAVARAWAVGLLGGVSRIAGRRASPLAALSVVALVFLCADPTLLFDLGFQLSISGVASILLFAGLLEGWLAAAAGARFRPLLSGIALSAAAIAGTLPMAASAFGFVSLAGLVSNLAAIPFVVAGTALGALGLTLSVVPLAGGALLALAAALCAMLLALAGAAASMPGAAVAVGQATLVLWVGWAAALLAVWAIWPQPRRIVARLIASGAAVCLAFAAVGATGTPGASVTVLDVGQGDAILVRDGPHAMLVDTGPTGGALLHALGRNHVTAVDAVLITHLHADHYGGLATLASVMRVPVLLIPCGTLAKHSPVMSKLSRAAGCPVREVTCGDIIREGGLDLDVVAPARPVADPGTNEASVVMTVRDGSEQVLLTGDAEKGVLHDAEARGCLGGVDVLKVGHHGSAIALDDELMRTMHPRIAIISVGAGNRYGHPTAACLSVLSHAGVPVLRTDQVGDVEVLLTPSSVRVVARGVVPVLAAGAACDRSAPVYLAALAPSCGTLALGARSSHAIPLHATRLNQEPHGCFVVRPQTGLPHLRVRGPPARKRSRATDKACWGRGRSGLQLGHVRRRKRGCRGHGGGVQHAAIRERAASRHREECRQAR